MSIKDYEGGIITKNPTTPTGPYQDGVASGVWTMDQAAEYTKQGVWPIAGNVPPYVEDVFSTYLYEGNGTSQTITNGIDLSGEGGMVWIKSRPDTYGHRLIDTERGVLKVLESYDTTAEATQAGSLTAFNSNGFDVGNAGHTNFSGNDFVSWTFRKAEKFFDVVTYTGDGTTGREIPHNLGSTPGAMFIKRTDAVGDWKVFHKSLSNGGLDGRLRLDSTGAEVTLTNNFFVSDTYFGSDFYNGSGQTYVAYLFASDAGGFGDDGSESIIKCGSYTGDGVSGNEITGLGWEPQWLMVKRAGSGGVGNWFMVDTMRGIVTAGAELGPSAIFDVTPDGFIVTETAASLNASGVEYIYIAIRRPMKTPESGTEVFTPTFGTGSGFNFVAGFPVDMAIIKAKDNVITSYASARLNSGTLLSTASTAAEFANAPAVFDSQVGYYESSLGSNYIGWLFKRATGFFDVRCYKGDTSSPPLVVSHGLSVTPEMMVVKDRSSAQAWAVYHKDIGATGMLRLNETSGIYTSAGYWNNTAPTASEFTVGTSSNTNGNGNDMLALLFATLDGISKVGSYTGTAADLDVDCGFTAGARFILIKRSDSTGDWYVYDSARGIVSGNDPYLLLNSTAAEVTGTDYIDPLSSGFTVTSSAPAGLNASGGTYIFLAIA